MGFKSWHTPFDWGIFTEWTNLVTAFKRKTLGLWTISKPFSCCDWYYKAVSKRYWNRKSQSHQRIYSSPFGKLWNASIPTLLEMLFDYVRIRFPTTDVQQVVENILQLKLSYFSSWGLWFLFLFRALCFRRHIRPLLPWTGQRSSGGIERSWCRQFESYLLAQQRSWYEFFMDVLVAGGVMKRLDLAINDKTGILNIPVLTWKVPTGRMYLRLPQF